MKKGVKKGLLISVIAIFFIILIAFLMLKAYGAILMGGSIPWIPLIVDSIISSNPPEPKIKYGEFPFTLVYEIDDETIVTEDTLIIEYKGVGWNEAQGKYNKWNRYLKSQRVKGYIRHNVILFNGLLENGNSAVIYLELGSCEYYMGLEDDMKYYYYSNIKPGDIVINSRTYTGPINEEELLEKFNIKIIKKTISNPISGP